MSEPETPADDPAVPEQPFDLVRVRTRADVEVLRPPAQDQVADAAAHQVSRVLMLVQAVEHPERIRIDVAARDRVIGARDNDRIGHAHDYIRGTVFAFFGLNSTDRCLARAAGGGGLIYPRPMRPLTRLVVAASAALVTPLVLAAQTGRPMAIRDLIGAVRVADPQVSPAGDLVAYVRTTTDPATGKRNADVWVVPADGSAAPKILLAGEKTENTPRWSPDGRQLAFISTRDGDAQVYLANADGTNVRKVTNISGGVQPPLVFSHDGSTLAFVADVYPECADDACNRQKRDAADKDPVKVHVMTRLLYRHWDEWREGVRHHVFVVPAAGGTARDLTPGDFDSPPGQQEDNAIAFSSDNKSIAFVSNREGNDKEAWTTNNDVWLVPVSGGAAKKLTANPAADDQPVFTPDGKSMIVRAQRRPGFESDRFYLDVYDLAAGTKRTVFETPDLSVSDYVLDSDSQAIYFTATSQGTDNLYRVGLAGGTPTEIVHGGAIGSPSIGKRRIAFSRSTMTAPADLWSVARDGGANAARVQLTHENDGVAQDGRVHRAGKPHRGRRRGRVGAVLDRQAAELRRVEEVPRGVSDPRRSAGRLGRRLVGALESGALGRAGLGRRRAQSARIDRLRPEVRRRHLPGLGRQGHGRSHRRVRRRRRNCRTSTRRARASPARATAATRWTGSSATPPASRPP